MKTLKAPDGHLSVVVNGNQFPVQDGLVRLEDSDAAAIQNHDPRFVDHNPAQESGAQPGVDNAARAAIDEISARLDRVAKSADGPVAAQVADIRKKLDDLAVAFGGEITDIRAKADDLDRRGLFATLRTMGVVVNQTTATEKLREIYAAECAKADAAKPAAPEAKPQPEAPAAAEAQPAAAQAKPVEGGATAA